jgi:nicotinamidase-related amidase
MLLIDVQVNMFDPANPAADANALIGRLEELLARARAAEMLVAFVRNCGGPSDPDQRGAPGWELHPSFQATDDDLVFDKTTSDAFESTALGDELNSRGIKRLVIAGLQSDYCIRATTLGAIQRGLGVTLVSDGHSTYDGGGQTAAEISAGVNAELDGRVKLEKSLLVELA